MATTTFALPVGTICLNAPVRQQASVVLIRHVSDVTSVSHGRTEPSTSLYGPTTTTY
jgi:hypothetical protein